MLILVGCQLGSAVPGSGGTAGRVGPLDSACAGVTSLEGTVLAPAQLVSNGAATLVANNASGLVANNQGAYRVQAIATVPVAGAQVDLLDGVGSTVGSTQSDDSGRYSYACLPANTAYLIQAHFAIPGASFVEQTIGRTPPATQGGAGTQAQVASVTPATTLAAAKLLTTAGTAAIAVEPAQTFDALASALDQDQATISLVVLASEQQSAAAVDQLAQSHPDIGSAAAALEAAATASASSGSGFAGCAGC